MTDIELCDVQYEIHLDVEALRLHLDAALYHLQASTWTREEAIAYLQGAIAQLITVEEDAGTD